MIPVMGTHVAAPLRVFISNGHAHSPDGWAIVTARMLVSAGQNISPDRLEAVASLRAKMQATLVGHFQAVKSDATMVQIDAAAADAVARFKEHAASTPWQMEFANETIAAMMHDVVRRNLATHADILLRTE